MATEERKERQREYNRRYRQKHPDKAQASRDAWTAKNGGYKKPPRDPEKHRKRHYKWRYGISLEQYNEMVVAQDGRCAICRGPPTRNGRLYVDHDHKTGKVRGLLCWEDNLVLGQAKDSPERLRAAAEYLERS